MRPKCPIPRQGRSHHGQTHPRRARRDHRGPRGPWWHAAGLSAAVGPDRSVARRVELNDACINPTDAYGAPRACQLDVQVLTPVCDNEVPKLKYKVDAVGTPNTR